MTKIRVAFLLSFARVASLAMAGENMIPNPGFEHGLTQWRSSFAEPLAAVTASARAGAKCVRLKVDGQVAGIDSERQLVIGEDLFRQRRYLVSAWTKNAGVTRGGFGLRLYFYDEEGLYLRMYSAMTVGPGDAAFDWRKNTVAFGADSDRPIPPGAATCKVRFSFWGKDGAAGDLWLDDVSLAPDPSHKAGPRGTAKTAAVWIDPSLGIKPSTDPNAVAKLLEQNGFSVQKLSTQDLCSKAKLSPSRLALLVLPYADVFPAAGGGALKHYLANGGSFVSLEGLPFTEPILSTGDGWAPAGADTGVCMRLDDQGLWKSRNRGTQDKLEVSAGGDGHLRFAMPDLQQYAYAGVTLGKLPDDAELIVFEAKGDGNTPYLAVEIMGRDRSRWKHVVPLTQEWAEYRVHLGSFVSYATDSRGEGYDFVKPAEAATLWLGFPASVVGKGAHVFEVRYARFCRAAVRGERVAKSELAWQGALLAERFFAPQVRNERGGASLSCFQRAGRVANAGSLAPAGGQHIMRGPAVQGEFSGVPLTVGAPEPPKSRKKRKLFDHVDTRAQFMPCLWYGDDEARRAAAALVLHDRGAYAHSVWAAFGLQGADLLSYEPLRQGLANMAKLIASGITWGRLKPSFAARERDVVMNVELPVFNRGDEAIEIEIRSTLECRGEGRALVKRAKLAPYAWARIAALSLPASELDWQRFRIRATVETTGLAAGASSLEVSLDTRQALRDVGDFLVEQGKDDAKFSKTWYFVDHRGVRGLAAAYDLIGDKRYLQTALNWADAIVSEQRDDGGYRMGYGITSKGEACFVADGGEIALAIARLVSYTTGAEQKLLMDSLRRYMAYRDSFRCEGGGIGVGWCLNDYSKRPITKLDKPTRIYAPERNTYTIGCTLLTAYPYARLTGDPADEAAAERDAEWLMPRVRTLNGAFIESYIYAHAFTTRPTQRRRYGELIKGHFLEPMVARSDAWWLGGQGRSAVNLDGLAYCAHRLEPEFGGGSPAVRAKMMQAAYAIFSPQSGHSVYHIITKPTFWFGDWTFLCFGFVSLPDVVQPMATMKPFDPVAD